MATKPSEMPSAEREPAREFVKKYNLDSHAHLELIEMLEKAYSSAISACDAYYDGVIRFITKNPKE